MAYLLGTQFFRTSINLSSRYQSTYCNLQNERESLRRSFSSKVVQISCWKLLNIPIHIENHRHPDIFFCAATTARTNNIHIQFSNLVSAKDLKTLLEARWFAWNSWRPLLLWCSVHVTVRLSPPRIERIESLIAFSTPLSTTSTDLSFSPSRQVHVRDKWKTNSPLAPHDGPGIRDESSQGLGLVVHFPS